MSATPYPDEAALRAAAERGAPVPSPCISICKMVADTGLCEGCHRTIEEIARWGSMGNEARLAVWGRIAQRRAA